MRTLDNKSRRSFHLEDNRLETPAMVGYRNGMSSSGVIGRKLGTVFSVQSEIPQEMGEALQELNGRLGRDR